MCNYVKKLLLFADNETTIKILVIDEALRRFIIRFLIKHIILYLKKYFFL